MLNAAPVEEPSTAALDQFRVAARVGFWTIVEANHMPPMAAMRLAAMALGSLYREVASAHARGAGCPCGWRPSAQEDIETLLMALSAGARSLPEAPSDLYAAKAAGNA